MTHSTHRFILSGLLVAMTGVFGFSADVHAIGMKRETSHQATGPNGKSASTTKTSTRSTEKSDDGTRVFNRSVTRSGTKGSGASSSESTGSQSTESAGSTGSSTGSSPQGKAGKWPNRWWSAGMGSLVISSTSGNCGRFETQNGVLSECKVSADGRVLTGNWKRQDGKYGHFQFTLVKDGRTFEGKSWYNDDKLPAIWNGKLERVEGDYQ